jgi:hypothetical protein
MKKEEIKILKKSGIKLSSFNPDDILIELSRKYKKWRYLPEFLQPIRKVRIHIHNNSIAEYLESLPPLTFIQKVYTWFYDLPYRFYSIRWMYFKGMVTIDKIEKTLKINREKSQKEVDL